MGESGSGTASAAEARAARVAELLFSERYDGSTTPAAAREPEFDPELSPDDVSAVPLVDHARSRAFVAWYGNLLDAHREGARALAEQNLSTGSAPEVDVSRGDSVDDLLRVVHQALLEHPIAARAIFAGLVREGRRHAATPEGRALRERLARSREVHRAALLWRTLTMGMLSEADEGGLPSAYLDGLTRLALDPGLERTLSRLASKRGAR